jgi:serine/threonine protein kinase
MAAVFAATHRNRNRVAVKVLLPEFANHPELRERFLREGYLTNGVGHPGAVRVFDDDVAEDGLVYLVMELLEGETLEQLVRRRGGTLDVSTVLDILDRLLAVLEAAHEQQIIHRDLKPENVFLTRDGDLRVLDFGIARLREHSDRLHITCAGHVLGTPGFIPPEQALGQWERVDQRSDLWAVGAIAWYLLAGREVHEGTNPHLQLLASAMNPVERLCDAAPTVPVNVGRIVDRALAFDPDDRWPSAVAMRDAIAMLDLSLDPPLFDLAPLTADDILDEEVELSWIVDAPVSEIQGRALSSEEGETGQTLRPPAGDDSVAWYAAEERLAALARVDSSEEQARELFEVASFYADDLADYAQASDCLHQALAAWPAHKPSFEKLETLLTASRQWEHLVDLYLLRRDAIEDERDKAQLTNRAIVVLCDRMGDVERARDLCRDLPEDDLETTWSRMLGRGRRTGS